MTAFRDPFVWREDEFWYVVIGSGVEKSGGFVLLYRSADLRSWEYVGQLCGRSRADRDPIFTGSVWECPQFFRLGEDYVLLFGVWDDHALLYTVYMVGEYTHHRFTPRLIRRFDLGPDFYAPATMQDEQGRRLVWGWSWEARSIPAQREAGWAGVMAAPRVLSAGRNGLLDIAPAPELAALRARHWAWRDLPLTPRSTNCLEPVRGDSLEILARLTPDRDAVCALSLRRSPHAAEQTVIRYDAGTQELTLDRSRASLRGKAVGGAYGGTVPLDPDGRLALHVFLDRTIIEVFANRTSCLTARIYPQRPDSVGLALEVSRGEVRLESLDVWELAG